MSKSPKNLASAFSAWVLLGQLGLTVAVPIVLGVLAGRYLDDVTGLHGLFLTLFLLIGIVCGILGAWRILARLTGEK